ncbi:MAG: DUF3078 domain-containing protein [Chitinophagaceae bacterium]|nr:DUF3078 domain-containing protein [Chitinophagaceae bacterium]
MRKSFLALALLFSVIALNAQDKSVQDIQSQAARGGKDDTSKKAKGAWKTGGNFSLNVGQGGSRNWAAGSEKFSLSVATYLNLFANRQIGKWSWNNTADLAYALVNTHSLGVRKTDDKIDLFSKFGREIARNLNLSLVGNFRSQFNDGYDYNYLGKGYKRRTSGWMAPAYITLAPGLDWRVNKYLTVFFSPFAGRMIVVTREPKGYFFQAGIIPPADGGGFETPVSVFYGVDPTRQVRTEFGGFASINFAKEIVRNVFYKSRLDLYSNYLETKRYTATGPDQLSVTTVGGKPQNVDVFWTNTFNMNVNKWLQVTYNFDLIYDDDVRQFGPDKNVAAAQLRSLLGIGVSAKF